MFGADTPLVIDALQIAAIALIAGAGSLAVYLRYKKPASSHTKPASKADLEERVRVLERIATDRSQDLSDEIDSLGGPQRNQGNA